MNITDDEENIHQLRLVSQFQYRILCFFIHNSIKLLIMFNTNYFQTVINLLTGRQSMLSAVWSMIWQALYAVVGCVLGAIILGHSGALIGTIVGAWIGYRSVYPYNSLINQLNKLDDHQKKVLTDEIRRTVGSSNVENLLQYAMNGNGQQLIVNLIQNYLKNQTASAKSNIFTRLFS